MATQAQREQQQIHQHVINDTLARIAAHKGVVGYIVYHPRDGRLLRFVGFDKNRALVDNYVDKLHSFMAVVQSTVRTLDHEDDLTFLRMRWKQREIIMAPDLNREYVLLVVQDQVQEEKEKPAISPLNFPGKGEETA